MDVAPGPAEPVAAPRAANAFEQAGPRQGLQERFNTAAGQAGTVRDIGGTHGAGPAGMERDVQHDENSQHAAITPDDHAAPPKLVLLCSTPARRGLVFPINACGETMSNRIPRELDVPFAAAPRGRIYDNVLQTVGGTPMVRLPRLAAEEGFVADLVLKLEFFNPLGSVKDRIGLGMVLGAEREGLITPGNRYWWSRPAAIPGSRWPSSRRRAATG